MTENETHKLMLALERAADILHGDGEYWLANTLDDAAEAVEMFRRERGWA